MSILKLLWNNIMFLTNLGKDMFMITCKNLMIVLIISIFACAEVSTKSNNKDNTMTEAIIGEQIWMAENLNVSTFRNGDTIFLARTAAEWKLAGEKQEPAYCYFNYDTANVGGCGKLYNWYAVNNPRGLAPIGWRVPTRYDYYALFDYLNSTPYSTQDLMSTSGWSHLFGTGTNTTGFNAFPCLSCHSSGAMVAQQDSTGLFLWTSSPFKYDKQHNQRQQYWLANFDSLNLDKISDVEIDKTCAFVFFLNQDYLELIGMPKGHGFYLRCIKE